MNPSGNPGAGAWTGCDGRRQTPTKSAPRAMGCRRSSASREVSRGPGDDAVPQRKHRFLLAYPPVENAPSNAICRKLGFTLLGATDYEYPKGNPLRCNDWRLARARVSSSSLAEQKSAVSSGFLRADARTRTGDPFITSEVLYQLSYVGGPRILAARP
jgi:hypothetical protein